MDLPNQLVEAATQPSEGSNEPDSRLLAAAISAVRRLDFSECERIIASAVENPHEGAVPALCALLQRPHGYWAKRAWRRPGYIEMRISAVQALQRIGSPTAAQPLANVLLYDETSVRTHVSGALADIGDVAVPVLIDQIQKNKTWSLEGMLDVIITLSVIGDKRAGPVLARVLLSKLPDSSDRWIKRFASLSLLAGVMLTLLFVVFVLFDKGSIGEFTPIGAIVGLLCMVGGFTVVCGGIISTTGVITHQKNAERKWLNIAAADALISVQDLRSIPSMIEIASSRDTSSARACAERVMLSLLPLLGPADGVSIDPQTERKLNGLLARNDAPLNLAVIRALEFVGTGASAATVERLTSRKSMRRYEGAFAEVLSEATRILPILQDRKRQEEDASVLLRHSQASSPSPQELLRPVSNADGDPEHADHLLRAVNDDVSSHPV